MTVWLYLYLYLLDQDDQYLIAHSLGRADIVYKRQKSAFEPSGRFYQVTVVVSKGNMLQPNIHKREKESKERKKEFTYIIYQQVKYLQTCSSIDYTTVKDYRTMNCITLKSNPRLKRSPFVCSRIKLFLLIANMKRLTFEQSLSGY